MAAPILAATVRERQGTAYEEDHDRPRHAHRGHATIDIYSMTRAASRTRTFHVTQIRGFEKFTEGRPFTKDARRSPRASAASARQPPVASAKSCDAIMAVSRRRRRAASRADPPGAQFLQSHASAFSSFGARLLLGFDSDPRTATSSALMKKARVGQTRRGAPPVRPGDHRRPGQGAHNIIPGSSPAV